MGGQTDIIIETFNWYYIMTFSEYVSTRAMQEYLKYCRANKIKPEVDVEIKAKKLCALVKPKTQ